MLGAVAVLGAAAREGTAARLGAAAGGSPLIQRGPAQRLARQELARSRYRPSWTSRVLDAIGRWLASLLESGPGGQHHVQWWAVGALILIVVLIIAGVLYLLGPMRRSARGQAAPVLDGSQLSAADHRRNSERHAAGGDFAAAVIERMRAIAVDLEGRGVLPPRPGRTASELAAEAARALPATALPATALPGGAAALHDAARLFDDVRYGGRAGTRQGYELVRDLDSAIMSARTASVAAIGGSGPGPAAGRGPEPRPQ